jgi:hypothetical protein
LDPRSGRQVTLSLETEYDDQAGIVHGLESFTHVGDAVPFLEVPLRFRLVRADAFRQLAEDARFEVESVRAGFTGAEYREGQSPTAVWTLRLRRTV